MSSPEAPVIGSVVAPAIEAVGSSFRAAFTPSLTPEVSLNTFQSFNPTEFFRPSGAMDLSMPDVGGRISFGENPFSYTTIISQPEPNEFPDLTIPAPFIQAFSNQVTEPIVSMPLPRLMVVEPSLIPAPVIEQQPQIELGQVLAQPLIPDKSKLEPLPDIPVMTPSMVKPKVVISAAFVAAEASLVFAEPVEVPTLEPKIAPRVVEIQKPEVQDLPLPESEAQLEVNPVVSDRAEPKVAELSEVLPEDQQVMTKIQVLRERLAQLQDQLVEQKQQESDSTIDPRVVTEKFYFFEAEKVMAKRRAETAAIVFSMMKKEGVADSAEVAPRLPGRRDDLESPLALELRKSDPTYFGFKETFARAGILTSESEVEWAIAKANRENRAVRRGQSGQLVSDQEVEAVVHGVKLDLAYSAILGEVATVQRELAYWLTAWTFSVKIQKVQPSNDGNGLEKVTTSNTTHN
jgi:hypothetical protein